MRKKKRAPQSRVKAEALADLVIEDMAKPLGKTAKTKTAMMIEAGYTTTTARANSKRTWTSASFQDALRRRGVTEDALTRVFSEAMDATKVANHKGELHETNIPDHALRLSAAKEMAAITGVHAVKRIATTNVNIDVSDDDISKILGL